MKCESCFFYRAISDKTGSCRRYPPNHEHEWPVVKITDWCGEYLPA